MCSQALARRWLGMWSWVFLTVLDTILKALGFGTCQPFNGFKQSEDATKIPLLGPRNRAAVAQSFRRCWLTHARVFFQAAWACYVSCSTASRRSRSAWVRSAGGWGCARTACPWPCCWCAARGARCTTAGVRRRNEGRGLRHCGRCGGRGHCCTFNMHWHSPSPVSYTHLTLPTIYSV